MAKLIETVKAEPTHTVELTQSEWNTISLLLGQALPEQVDALAQDYNIKLACKNEQSYNELYTFFRQGRE